MAQHALPATPAPRDVAYPGTVTLAVDATDVTRGIFRVSETLLVAGPGPLTLLYPEWLPGNHSPFFAPVAEPSIKTSVKAMSMAVLTALQR